MTRVHQFLWRGGVLIALTFGALHNTQAQSLAQAKLDLKKLSSKKFRGRGYSSNGHLKAAKWLAHEYQVNKVKPFKGQYLHPFIIPAVNVIEDKPSLKINQKKLELGVDFLPHAATGSGKGALKDSASIAQFLGIYNQSAPYFHQEINELDSNIDRRRALLFFPQKLMGNVGMSRHDKPILEISKPIDQPIKSIRYKVKSTLKRGIESHNVAGFFQGKDTTSWIIIAAHYDHLGGYSRRFYFPGASDNGSGMALLLSILRHFATSSEPPPVNLLCISFGGEELGLQGSYAFIKQHPELLPKIKWMLNLDITGTGDDGITVVNGTLFPELFDKIVAINKQKQLLPKITIRGKAPISDHHWFTESGVPSLYIYTASKEFTYYHHRKDIPSNVSLSHFTNLHQLIQSLITE